VDTFQLTKIGNDWMMKEWSKPTVSTRVKYTYFQVNAQGDVTAYAEKRDDRAWDVMSPINPETGKYVSMEDALDFSSFNELFSAWFDMEESDGAYLDSDFQPTGETTICGVKCVVYTKEDDAHIFAVAEPTKLIFKIDMPYSERFAQQLLVVDYTTSAASFPIGKP
jgi:hypothetical protein